MITLLLFSYLVWPPATIGWMDTPTTQQPAPTPAPPTDSHRSWHIGNLKVALSLLVFFGFVFGAAAFLNAFVFQSYFVDGTSMTPTLGNGDRLIISKVERTVSGIEHKPYVPTRGQIVVLDSSVSEMTAARNEQIIKRIIGLPNERVHIEGGTVTIYNQQHPEGFDVNASLGLHLEPTYSDGVVDETIPPDHVFVMGDNRVNGGSYDSRSFGYVSVDKIIGRLWLRILPLDRIGGF